MKLRGSRRRTAAGLATIVIVFAMSACSGAAVGPTSTPTPTPAPTSTANSSTTAGPTLVFGATPLDAGAHTAHVIGQGTYPSYAVVVPAGWYDAGDGHFVIKYPTGDQPAPVLGLSVWDVGQVFRDPCHWQGQAVDPGPGVAALVTALVAQPMRNATAPTDVTLATYTGRYLEWSVPADMKSSAPSEFDACDLDSEGHRDFNSWLGNGMGNRYEQVPGQVDRLWVLDLKGQRLVVDATYSPDTTQLDRDEEGRIVESLRFVAP